MRKLKGITINGEWLGDNVIINGLFRAICEISPNVMQEFIRIINSIDKLDEAVKINKFSFPDNNSIEIEFSNKSLNGLADLYFYLDNGIPKLRNSKLIFKNQEEKLKEELCETEQLSEINTCEYEHSSQEENLQEEIIENLIDKEIAETISGFEENFDIEKNKIQQDSEEKNITSLDQEYTEKDDFSATENYSKEAAIAAETVEQKTDNEVKDTDNDSITKDTISSMVDEIIAKAPNLAGLTQPVQIQLIQPESCAAPQIQPIIIQTPAENSENKNIQTNEIIHSDKPAQQNEQSVDTKQDSPKESSEQNDNNEETIDNINTITEEAEITTPFDYSDEKINITEAAEEDSAEDTNNTNDSLQEEIISENFTDSEVIEDIPNIEENNLIKDIDENPEEFDDVIQNSADEIFPDTEIHYEQDENSTKDSFEKEDNEIISECLADFYNIEEPSNEIQLDEKARDNIAMQAMLSEVVMLKQELNRLKTDQPKPTLSEFFGDNEQEYDEIEDEDADFKIMADGTRINASILDEDLFIAGKKLYRWGDTLYLEE